MATLSRLAGAMLLQTEGAYYLIGNTKVPCDFAGAGFEPPVEIDALARPYIGLAVCGPVRPAAPRLRFDAEGEDLAKRIAGCFVIERTGSISERLWRLAIGESDESDEPVPDESDGNWLVHMPLMVWQVVRDSVLRCS